MSKLKDKVIFITGASRGIGEAIALRCAEDGAKIVIAAKTTEQHSVLPGTIYTVAKEIERSGGQVLPIQVDIRYEEQILSAIDQTIQQFGQLDILINNASAISPTPIGETTMKKFDLMFSVNVRGTFACSKAAIPHLEKSTNPHILNLSPPLNMQAHWFENRLAYTISKYGMSMCTLGLSEELRNKKIAVNSLWPKTTIATSAVKVFFEEVYNISRKPSIMADAAYEIITSDSQKMTGNFFVDEIVLRNCGMTDFSEYALDKSVEPPIDFFLNPEDFE